LAAAFRDVVRRLDAGLPPPDVHAVSASRTDSAGGPRFNLWVVGAFAGLALILAMTGVYGTLAFTVAQRRQEIAVRLALGATSSRVVGQVLRTGIGVAGLGIAVGLGSALVATRALESLLFGVAPHDPATFLAAAAVLFFTAAAACYLPARRAAGVDPAMILRD
jgi:ABC-type antimicrobial peptide transport system permease subunit